MNDNAKKWVAALRSGKYPQGKSWLLKDGKYCCLGVACELAAQTGLTSSPSHPQFKNVVTFDGEDAFLPSSVRKWLGLVEVDGAPKNGPSLVDLNDKGKTFEEIADFIESEPEGLFRK